MNQDTQDMTPPDHAPASTEPPRMLLIETQSPWQSGDSADFLNMAATLVDAGALVHLHFIQNGVMWLAQNASALDALKQPRAACLRVSFDDISLDLRGIPRAMAAGHGAVGGMDKLVAEMADQQVKTIWHS